MRKIVVLFFVAFLLLLTIGCNRDSQKSNNQEEETTGISQEKDSDNNESSGKEDNKESFFIGDRYKDIILDDNHGNDERLSDYLDKPVLLSFWTSWSVESKNFNQLIKVNQQLCWF